MKIIIVDRDKDKLFAMAKGLSNQPDTHFFHGDFGDVPEISDVCAGQHQQYASKVTCSTSFPKPEHYADTSFVWPLRE